MAGQLDQISQAIGGLQATTDGLGKQLEVHCQEDRERHEDNLQSLRELTEEMRDIKDALQPLVKTVSVMEPIVDRFEQSRLKLTGALGLVVLILTAIGWLVEGLIAHFVSYMLGKH